MIWKNYVVTGEDVNGDMEMESTAYISYALRVLYRFLFDNGFSKEKLNTQHLSLQVENHELVCYKNLIFTESFFIKIENYWIDDKIKIKSCFFNSRNECCAEVTKEVEWFDHINREVIATPKQILKYFRSNSKA
jgi:hypothetical protein